jgi:hypothetical protein
MLCARRVCNSRVCCPLSCCCEVKRAVRVTFAARTRAGRLVCKQELFMEFGNPESRDEATGIYSGCSDKGECLIYTEKGDLIGRSQCM